MPIEFGDFPASHILLLEGVQFFIQGPYGFPPIPPHCWQTSSSPHQVASVWFNTTKPLARCGGSSKSATIDLKQRLKASRIVGQLGQVDHTTKKWVDKSYTVIPGLPTNDAFTNMCLYLCKHAEYISLVQWQTVKSLSVCPVEHRMSPQLLWSKLMVLGSQIGQSVYSSSLIILNVHKFELHFGINDPLLFPPKIPWRHVLKNDNRIQVAALDGIVKKKKHGGGSPNEKES